MTFLLMAFAPCFMPTVTAGALPTLVALNVYMNEGLHKCYLSLDHDFRARSSQQLTVPALLTSHHSSVFSIEFHGNRPVKVNLHKIHLALAHLVDLLPSTLLLRAPLPVTMCMMEDVAFACGHKVQYARRFHFDQDALEVCQEPLLTIRHHVNADCPKCRLDRVRGFPYTNLAFGMIPRDDSLLGLDDGECAKLPQRQQHEKDPAPAAPQ
ncbi:hypothetical protein VTO42DRAFT_5100 [Malbranchea cinnamomea]